MDRQAQWAQKVGVVETAAEFLRHRAGDARPEDLKPLLAEAPDVPPERGYYTLTNPSGWTKFRDGAR